MVAHSPPSRRRSTAPHGRQHDAAAGAEPTPFELYAAERRHHAGEQSPLRGELPEGSSQEGARLRRQYRRYARRWWAGILAGLVLPHMMAYWVRAEEGGLWGSLRATATRAAAFFLPPVASSSVSVSKPSWPWQQTN